MVSKKPGATVIMCAGRPAPVRPSTRTSLIHTPPPSSAVCAMVTDRTPGSPRTRSPMRAYSATESSGA